MSREVSIDSNFFAELHRSYMSSTLFHISLILWVLSFGLFSCKTLLQWQLSDSANYSFMSVFRTTKLKLKVELN